MKKFSVLAVLALGVISVSGAFAGNNSVFASASSADTIVNDTVAKDTTAKSIALNDTVVPADTTSKDTAAPAFGLSLNDTVVPADTVKKDSLVF